jgi:hypothetical protein
MSEDVLSITLKIEKQHNFTAIKIEFFIPKLGYSVRENIDLEESRFSTPQMLPSVRVIT